MGWMKKKDIAKYCGVTTRTLSKWEKLGLKCSVLPSGLRLFREEDVDTFLEKFSNESVKGEVKEILDKLSAN